MCVPLILQNRLSLAESFVTGHSHLEKRLVTLLDSWCHPSFSLEEICRYGSWARELQGTRVAESLDCSAAVGKGLLTLNVIV